MNDYDSKNSDSKNSGSKNYDNTNTVPTHADNVQQHDVEKHGVEEEIEFVSKSEMKRDAQACFELAETLTNLPVMQLDTLELDPEALHAIKVAQTIKAHGAKKRQLKLAAKLLRKKDRVEVENKLLAIQSAQTKDTQAFHHVEQWRDRLLRGNDDDIQQFMEDYPDSDRQQLRQLVRQAKKEQSENKPKKYQRQLFQLLKSQCSER